VKRDRKIALVVAALFGLIVLTMNAPKVVSLIRGIRNHNPGNIERNNIVWQGMAADQSADPRFIVFIDAKWGIRALTRILRNYTNSGIVTIRGMISRYAPGHENPTDSYIAAVSRAVGLLPDAPVNFERDKGALVRAIIRQENGVQPYSDDTINEGIRLERNA